MLYHFLCLATLCMQSMQSFYAGEKLRFSLVFDLEIWIVYLSCVLLNILYKHYPHFDLHHSHIVKIVKLAAAVKVKSIPLQNIVQWSGLTICHALSLYYSVIGDNNINRAGWLWLKCLVFGHSIPIIQDHFQIFRQFI